MKVKFYGTRGSIAVSGPDNVIYGGNTTSLLVESPCLPPDFRLVVDTGSGFVPLSADSLKEGVKSMLILYSHYHFDHTIGLTMGGVTYVKDIQISLYGPEEHGIGPAQMIEDHFRPPYFPVDHREVTSHIMTKGIDLPNSRVFVIHRQGGVKYLNYDHYEALEKNGMMVPFEKGQKFNLNECLVVKMYRSNHPERTISYRFEERPSGRVFVFLTDHENQDGMPWRLQRHVEGAHLLVMDGQYSRARYDAGMAGFGHGTPDYCVRVALSAGAGKLGLTHHDPNATDSRIKEQILEAETARNQQSPGSTMEIFACRDYQEVEI